MTDNANDRVSRRRYVREQAARAEAESLLEKKSRELYFANSQLSAHSVLLEQAVSERTAELMAALDKAEAASAARSRFVATMSHEIRTPLGGMLGMIDLLSMDETDPDKKEYLDYAKAAGTGLSRIVNDVLDFSKMEAGVFIFEEEHVDIRALVKSVKMIAGSHEKGIGRQIICKISDSVPNLFWGDATRFRQVISNLISNALRYSSSGPIIIRASTSDHAKGTLLRVEVQDFGIGIANAELDNLFKDFSQISNPLTAAAQGTGLGLAICKRILEGCGGTVGVESRLGEGSTFWFELPVKIVPQSEAESVKYRNWQGEAAPENLLGKRVLIAEDNIINQKLLLTYADRLGLQAELAENGRIAIEKFDPEKFDVVLMDVAMPEIDGLAAIRHIQEQWLGVKLPPILILTAHVMEAIEDEAKLVGVTSVLSKPIPFEELRMAMEAALAKGRQYTALRRDETETHPPKVRQNTLLEMMSPQMAKDLTEMFSIEALSNLARTYVDDANERLDGILEALNMGDALTVSQEAHSLKGASLVFGFEDVSQWAAYIEKSDSIAEREKVRNRVADIRAHVTMLSAGL